MYCKTAIILFVFELGHLSHDVWHMISIQTKSESGAGSNCHIRALLMMILDLGDVGESENPGGEGSGNVKGKICPLEFIVLID